MRRIAELCSTRLYVLKKKEKRGYEATYIIKSIKYYVGG